MPQSPLSALQSAESYACSQVLAAAAAVNGMADAIANVGAAQVAALDVMAAAAARLESAIPAAAARLESGHERFALLAAALMAKVQSLVDYSGLVATSTTGTAGLIGLMTAPVDPVPESPPAVPVAQEASPETVANVTGRGASERKPVETTIAPVEAPAIAGAPVNRIVDVIPHGWESTETPEETVKAAAREAEKVGAHKSNGRRRKTAAK